MQREAMHAAAAAAVQAAMGGVRPAAAKGGDHVASGPEERKLQTRAAARGWHANRRVNDELE